MKNLKKITSLILVNLLFGFGLCFSYSKLLADPLQSVKKVKLIAILTVNNKGKTEAQNCKILLTYPAVERVYQVLNGIEAAGLEYKEKTHKNRLDRYLEIPLTLKAQSINEYWIVFKLSLSHFEYKNDVKKTTAKEEDATASLLPSAKIESDSAEILKIADTIMRNFKNEHDRLKAAYDFTRKHLKYKALSAFQGALWAYRNRIGDCSEYAALFVAISRAMKIPARMTSEFNFKNSREFSQPNHNAAEVLLDGRWIPVDPNLGLVQNSGFGFGISAMNKIVLKREEPWVWSKPAGVKGISKDYLLRQIEFKLRWAIETDE